MAITCYTTCKSGSLYCSPGAPWSTCLAPHTVHGPGSGLEVNSTRSASIRDHCWSRLHMPNIRVIFKENDLAQWFLVLAHSENELAQFLARCAAFLAQCRNYAVVTFRTCWSAQKCSLPLITVENMSGCCFQPSGLEILHRGQITTFCPPQLGPQVGGKTARCTRFTE